MIAKMSSLKGPEGAGLRWVGLGLVAVGLFIAYTRFPTRSADSWAAIQSFELDSEECEALRKQRLTTELTVVPDDDVLPTYREVAQKFNLELALVCQANGLADDCGAGTAPAESQLDLPLYRDTASRLEPAVLDSAETSSSEAP